MRLLLESNELAVFGSLLINLTSFYPKLELLRASTNLQALKSLSKCKVLMLNITFIRWGLGLMGLALNPSNLAQLNIEYFPISIQI